MKRLFYSTLILLLFSILADAQTVIKMKKESGVYNIPCKVNDIPLKMIFDTGASNMCISAVEALVMIRSGTITEDDIIGNTRYQTASGEIEEGAEINIRKIEVGGLLLKNVRATVIYSLDAPLLLGQSVLERLGRIQVDYASRTITVFDGGTRQYDYSSSSVNSIASIPESTPSKYSYSTTLKDGFNNISLYQEPNTSSRTLLQVPRYHEVNVISEYNNVFNRVRVDGKIGYMEKRHLKK